MLRHLCGSVLGVPWNTARDVISMKLTINLSRKIDLAVLTLRIITSQVYGIYDPLGLLSPVTVKYKLLLQKLTTHGLAWDDPIPEDLDAQAREILKEIVLAGEIKFPRALMEEDTDTGDLMLVGFGDGGNAASCAAVYLRSRRSRAGPNQEMHRVRLVVGKAWVTPLSKAAGNLRKDSQD